MEINQLPPGSPIEIYSVKSINETKENDENNEEAYISSLFDITKSGELIIHMPTKQGHLVTLPLNVEYNFITNTHAGLFQLSGKLVNRGKIEKFPVYIVKPTSAIKKVQRREYYRFECAIPVVAQPITREIGLLPTNLHVERALLNADVNVINDTYGTILDISGGGARFTARVDINTDSYMLLKFDIPTSNGIVPMKIVSRRVKSEYKDDKGIYEHRVEFMFKEQEEREIIIKYIFDQERRIRKRVQG